MFDEEKRREEIRDAWNYKKDTETFGEFVTRIISQEKSMIEQEKKEAVKEFADAIYDEIVKEEPDGDWMFITIPKFRDCFIDKLLKDRGIE